MRVFNNPDDEQSWNLYFVYQLGCQVDSRVSAEQTALQVIGSVIWASLGKSGQVGGDGKSWSPGHRDPHLGKSSAAMGNLGLQAIGHLAMDSWA